MSRVTGGIANNLIREGTVVNYLIAGSRVSYLGKTGNLVKLSTSGKNSGLSAPLLLIKLLTLAELTALVGELLFIGVLVGLVLASLTLKVGLIPIESLAEFITLITAKPIIINGPAPLALPDYLAKSLFIKFSSLRLSQAVVAKESISFFPGI